MTAGKYFYRNVLALDHRYISHFVQETYDQIVVFGKGNKRYDIFLFLKLNLLVTMSCRIKYRTIRTKI
jgi:hypothetical protein